MENTINNYTSGVSVKTPGVSTWGELIKKKKTPYNWLITHMVPIYQASLVRTFSEMMKWKDTHTPTKQSSTSPQNLKGMQAHPSSWWAAISVLGCRTALQYTGWHKVTQFSCRCYKLCSNAVRWLEAVLRRTVCVSCVSWGGKDTDMRSLLILIVRVI